MKKINWSAVVIVGLLITVLLFAAGMFSGQGYNNTWGYRGYSMMGPGMMNWGYSPFGWFGMGLGMLFMWLVPVGVIALVVYGVVSLTRNNGNPTTPASQSSCPDCGKSVQADWQNCPYCGTSLK